MLALVTNIEHSDIMLQRLVEQLIQNPGYCVLTGAGCSTESGLPTYRDDQGQWQHTKPMEHRDFVGNEHQRQYYWARSMQGWPTFCQADPSKTHQMLTLLQKAGYINQIITQNVDRLHQRSGSADVIDLHGRLDQVQCLNCQALYSREHHQQRLQQMNPDIQVNGKFIRPDGDIDIEIDDLQAFKVPACEQCTGVLKPNVVFFGGLLYPQDSHKALNAVETAPGLIVIGSSLMVYSGYRLVKLAERLAKPIFIINQGVTRADDLTIFKIETESGKYLSQLVSCLDLIH